MSGFFEGRTVLVTGAAGLIGSAFLAPLRQAGARIRAVRHHRALPFPWMEAVDGDLKDPAFCRHACTGADIVIHGAGISGGSRQVQVDPIPMFTDSLWMNTLMLEAARLCRVGRFLFISNSSVYPPGDHLLKEAMGAEGAPENATGMVKRAGETQAILTAAHSDLKVAILRTGNAYGPRDDFGLESSHVLPALVRRAVDMAPPFTLWGDGSARRDFIATHDIARAGLFLLERHAVAEPVNVATGRVVSIRELAEMVLAAAGRLGETIHCTGEAPPAPPAKVLDLARMRALGFAPEWSLEQGVRDTVDWYRARGTSS